MHRHSLAAALAAVFAAALVAGACSNSDQSGKSKGANQFSGGDSDGNDGGASGSKTGDKTGDKDGSKGGDKTGAKDGAKDGGNDAGKDSDEGKGTAGTSGTDKDGKDGKDAKDGGIEGGDEVGGDEGGVNGVNFSFGGFFRTIGANQQCQIKNPKTDACSCPAGFDSAQVHEFFDRGNEYYCSGANSCAMALHACFKKPLKDVNGGFFRKYGDGSCADKNYYTGACSCPDGFETASLTEFSDAGSRFYCTGNTKVCAISAHQCVKKTAKGNGGGSYRVHQADNECQFANPVTGGCSCPDGYQAKLMDEFADQHRRFYCKSADKPCGVAVHTCIK